jgi:phenylpropionate dioxygenase-like ring-hydroxylating dioxygenase large terminal subunit
MLTMLLHLGYTPLASRSSSVPRAGRLLALEATAIPTTPASTSFDWFSQWYPVNVIETMDPSRPHAMQLLGLNLVAWNDGETIGGVKQEGAWRVFEDACPHRLGPLSEGRIEADGNLLCSYHGWRFDGSGACAEMPYAPPSKAERLKQSCRATCNAYPTRVADGLLWVFPVGGVLGLDASAHVAMPLIDELHQPELAGRWKWKIPAGVRDFPCSWDAMVENTLDPAHFCSAHHGTLGNRYEDPKPYQMALSQPISLTEGFAIDGELGRLEFKPPCLVKYLPNFAAMPFGRSLVIATYCVPTKPGWVRGPLMTSVVMTTDDEAWLGESASAGPGPLIAF